MFDKNKKVEQLEQLMDEGKLDAFNLLYQQFKNQGFDIDGYRSPLLGHDICGLLSSAMLQGQPDFAGFLIGKIPADEVARLTPEFSKKGKYGTYRATLLYLAIENRMDDIALQLIKNPNVDLGWGMEQEHTGSHGSTYWDNIEDTFKLAARMGNPKIIEALYSAHINDLNARANEIKEHAHFFKNHRSKKKLALAQEFTAARDGLLKKATGQPPLPAPPTGKPPTPKPCP